jgi:uncharacterized protein
MGDRIRIACVYHAIDLDGWMSTAIMKEWALQTSNTSDAFEIEYIGYVYKDKYMPSLNRDNYDMIVMVDSSLCADEMERLSREFDHNFVWIDHHASAINDAEGRYNPLGKRSVDFAACELAWQYFFPNEQMPEIVRLLGRYDCFGHMGTDEEVSVLEFQYGARHAIHGYKDAHKYLIMSMSDNGGEVIDEIFKVGKPVYAYLKSEAKHVYERGYEKFLIYPNDPLMKPHFVCSIDAEELITAKMSGELKKMWFVNQERFNSINFGIDYHKKGLDGMMCYHYTNGAWHFSVYCENCSVDASRVAKAYGGGGHKGAAGFIVEDIRPFLDND